MHAVRRLRPWHFSLVFLVPTLGAFLVLVVLGFNPAKEGTVTVYVWVPDNAASLPDLFGEPLQLDSSYNYKDAIPWKDTHTFAEFQELDATVNFFALVGGQIKYLALLRNADGTVSAARTTVSPEIPADGFWETRTVIFDPATGEVTAQYTRGLDAVFVFGIMPLVLWVLVTVGMAGIGVRWNEPVFPMRRAPA